VVVIGFFFSSSLEKQKSWGGGILVAQISHIYDDFYAVK
jgi:hypothetical protein